MMAAQTDHAQLADDILERVGGAENVDSAFHCATRLRMHLKDSTAADQQAVGELPGVLTVVEAGGQFQVVIGDEVGKVHQALVRHLPEGDPSGKQKPDSAEEKRNLFDRFIQMISAIITPIIWPLAGAGLFKAIRCRPIHRHGHRRSAGVPQSGRGSAGRGVSHLLGDPRGADGLLRLSASDPGGHMAVGSS